jgi:hypothetical protein
VRNVVPLHHTTVVVIDAGVDSHPKLETGRGARKANARSDGRTLDPSHKRSHTHTHQTRHGGPGFALLLRHRGQVSSIVDGRSAASELHESGRGQHPSTPEEPSSSSHCCRARPELCTWVGGARERGPTFASSLRPRRTALATSLCSGVHSSGAPPSALECAPECTGPSWLHSRSWLVAPSAASAPPLQLDCRWCYAAACAACCCCCCLLLLSVCCCCCCCGREVVPRQPLLP